MQNSAGEAIEECPAGEFTVTETFINLHDLSPASSYEVCVVSIGATGGDISSDVCVTESTASK